ncbi:MAG TPA: TIM barrel protein [Opitutales bacterium]|nr:TIM barrel protein [Opitutales bacterium]
MNQHITRRRFLSCAGTSAIGTALLPMVSCKALAGPPDQRFTMGLSQYSLRELFKSGSLDPLDYPQFSVDKFGIYAVDYWEGGLPKDKLDDMAYFEKLRSRAEAAGCDPFLLMTGGVNGAAKNLDANKKAVQAIKRTQALGARHLRIFMWTPDKGEEAAVAQGAVVAMKPLADVAAAHGVTLVVEPGASKRSQGGEFLAKVCGSLNHPNFRLMPDFGKLRGDIYAGTAAMMPYAAVISCKMHSFDAAGNQPDFDYPRLMKTIVDSGYKGILAIEWEGKELEPIPGVLASKKLIEKSLRLARA